MAKEKVIKRGAVKLTKSYLSNIEPTGKREMYRDSTVTGLVLRVSPDATNQTWYLDYYNHDNHRRLFRIGSTKQYELDAAKIKARELLAKTAKGIDIALIKQEKKREQKVAIKRSLRAFIEGDYWKKHLKYLSSGKGTRDRLLNVWVDVIDIDMQTLTYKKLNDIRSERRDSGINPSTLNRERGALISCLNHAKEWGLITDNPVEKWKPLTLEDDDRVRYLGQRDELEDHYKGERERFLKAIESDTLPDHVKPICIVAMNTGMRRGEILKLTWDKVSFQRREITLIGANTKAKKKRIVYLNETAYKALKQWREDQPSNIKKLVFPNPKTGKSLFSIKTAWKSICKNGSLTDFRFHDLRHDFCSRLIMEGKPLTTVRDLVGHSTIAMTERYAHLAPSHLKEAVEALK